VLSITKTIKKQGLPFQLDRRTFQHRAVKTKATGDKRDYIFTMNQIGGIGRVEWYPRDGIRPREPYQYGLQTISNETTISETTKVFTSDGYSSTTPNTFYYYDENNNYYILFSTVPCDPFTIKSLQLNTFGILEFNASFTTSATYIPNGPTNGNTGYVFKITNLFEFPPNLYTTNLNCSTENTNTLLIQNNGNRPIIINTSSILIQGPICNKIIKHIIYNNIKYDVLLYVFVTEIGTIFLINGNLETTEFNGSVQCI
jgi:hypothetical protein